MTTRIIINNFEKAPELCDSWGWYVDLDYENKCKKYKPKKYNTYIIKINYDSKNENENENENDDEYEYYMNQYKNHKTNKKINSSIPVFLEPIEEEKQEKQEKQEKRHYLIKLTSATIITGLLTYIIFFTI
jgi:hypothetical protein